MRNANETISVSISRLGMTDMDIEISKDGTIREALATAGLQLSNGEKVYVEGVAGNLDSILDEFDTVQIVGSKIGGSK